MLILKHLLKNGKGTGKITFFPETLTYINLLMDNSYLPGMNTPTSYRKEGIEALQYQELKEKEKELEFLNPSNKEVRRISKPQTLKEKVEGKKREYIEVPKGIGMSGEDPLLGTIFDFYIGGKGLELLGKTGLYSAARYFPRTKLGNYGRAYYLNSEMKLPKPGYKIFTNQNSDYGSPEEPRSIWGPSTNLAAWGQHYSGPIRHYTEQEALSEYFLALMNVINYIKGPEFKRRVLNSKLFTEDEYTLLVLDLLAELKNTRFKGIRPGTGAENSYKAVERSNYYYLTDPSQITLGSDVSIVDMQNNIWHELMHSAGGRELNTILSPLIQRLKNYDYNIINPTQPSKAFKLAFTNPVSMKDPLRGLWLRDNIMSRQHEVRSRMLTVLYRFRQLGYDTSELIDSPDKFIDWVNEVAKNRAYMPVDLSLLLMSYNIHDLANYASKILSTTGTFYLGNKILNNNENNIR